MLATSEFNEDPVSGPYAVEGDNIYVKVADESQYPSLTGIRNWDIIKLQLKEIGRCQCAPAQQEPEQGHKRWKRAANA
jgi:hypothetical protein